MWTRWLSPRNHQQAHVINVRVGAIFLQYNTTIPHSKKGNGGTGTGTFKLTTVPAAGTVGFFES